MPRLHSPTPISRRQLREHDRLADVLEDMRFAQKLRQPGRAVGGMEAVLLRRLMADLARFMSREPGGRALLRLPAGGPLDPETVAAALLDAEIALTAFKRAHQDSEEDCCWVMLEDAF
ncbi:MAG TPA: hypothetical protein VGN60_09725 [Devosia sp.]|jgi:hypothetical protein|nr:hypothetical protein [Devosia sp.]